jgi:two-component system nitrogen regulation response regulator GlnG
MPASFREDWRGSLEASTATAVSTQASAAMPRVPGLTILAHPDPRRIGARVALPVLASGRAVALSRLTPDFSPTGGGEALPLADPHLSRQALSLASGTEPGSVVLTHGVAGMAVEAGLTPLTGERTFAAAEVERGVVLLLAARVALPARSPFFSWIGSQ